MRFEHKKLEVIVSDDMKQFECNDYGKTTQLKIKFCSSKSSIPFTLEDIKRHINECLERL